MASKPSKKLIKGRAASSAVSVAPIEAKTEKKTEEATSAKRSFSGSVHPLFPELLKLLGLPILEKRPRGESKDGDDDGEVVEIPIRDTPLKLFRPLIKTMFKPDHPYRTKLAYFSSLTTSAAGVLNVIIAAANINSTGEWPSIDALFDEFFVHSVTLDYRPYNIAQVGFGSASTFGFMTVAGTSNNLVGNAGLVAVSIFNGAPNYGTAAAMLSNPTRRLLHSGRDWKYVWRNNVKFDPRGMALSSSTGEAWQGWTLITNSAQYGGTINIRVFNDQVLGDGAHAFQPGCVAITFDVSFRARS